MSFTPSGAPVLKPFTLTPADARRFLEESAQPPYDDERYRLLNRYEAFFRGLQYKHHQVDWWGMNADEMESISPMADTPSGFVKMDVGMTVRHKRPTIETGTAATIVSGYTSLMLSEQACPRIIVENDQDTEAMLLAIVEEAKFWQKWQYSRNLGGAVGSVALTFHLRDGVVDVEVHNTKQLIPLWRNRRNWKPAAFLKYWIVQKTENVFDERSKQMTGTKVVEWCYRRIITEAEDITYKPIRLDRPDTWSWDPDPALSVVHGLGFFPGVWVQNMPEEDDKDGAPDCSEAALKNTDALDRLMSQINKGVLANVDPTLVLKYDAKEVNPDQAIQVRTGSDTTIEPGASGDAKFLELMGGGIAAAERICDRIERYITQQTGYVFADPAKVMGSATSSLALKLLFRPMIQQADKLRMQYGPAIVQSLNIIRDVVAAFHGKKVPLPPAADGSEREGVFALRLPPRMVEVAGEGGQVQKKLADHRLGPGGPIAIQWGPYFNKSPQEEGTDITNAVSAKQGGLIDKVTAVKHVATPVFQVHDVPSMMARIDQEQADEVEATIGAAAGGVTGAGLSKLVVGGALGARPGHDDRSTDERGGAQGADTEDGTT